MATSRLTQVAAHRGTESRQETVKVCSRGVPVLMGCIDDYHGHPQWYGKTALYRYFDCTGDLVYVGISNEPWARHKAHTKSDWICAAAYRKMEWFPCREVAEWAETAAIEAEQPAANVKPGRAYDPPQWAAPWFFDQHGCKPVGLFPEWHTTRLYSRHDDRWCWHFLDECPEPYWYQGHGKPYTPGPQTVLFTSIRAAA